VQGVEADTMDTDGRLEVANVRKERGNEHYVRGAYPEALRMYAKALLMVISRPPMITSLAPEIHRWIRPASLKQQTVSFSHSFADGNGSMGRNTDAKILFD
jgi:hypothetical protein